MNQKPNLKIFLSKDNCGFDKTEAENRLKQIDEQLSNLSSARNMKIVQEHVKSLGTSEGNFRQLGMWKLKNKLWPREQDPPMAKIDEKGNLISSPSALKSLYLRHYVQRLEHRQIKEEYIENYNKKVKLWQLRYERVKSTVSPNWSIKQLRGAIKSLKNNKTRDPSGLLNELFKAPVMGCDLENAILTLLNGMKSEFFIPYDVQMANITSIYKSRGSKNSIESDRGIFGLSIFRKIADKLIYHEKYPFIDQNMSDSNIGARKKKNIRNHLFIIHGIINSVLNSESDCVDIQIYDLIKAFDVLWLLDSMNDMYDTLPPQSCDDRLGLVYEMSRNNMVAINTAVGQSERVNIKEFTAQGGTWGPLLCSNSIDTVGKVSEASGQFFLYKNIARIIPLAMVDDLISVRTCGFESIESNVTINTIIELKKLKFHVPEAGKKSKCHYLHVGKPNKRCPGMKVHGEKADRVEEAVY